MDTLWEGGGDGDSLDTFLAALYIRTPPGQQGQGELKEDYMVHLELAQHGVTALP